MANLQRSKMPVSLRRLNRARALLDKAEKRHRRAALQLDKWQKKVVQLEHEHRRAVQGSLWEEEANVALQQNPSSTSSIGTLFPA